MPSQTTNVVRPTSRLWLLALGVAFGVLSACGSDTDTATEATTEPTTEATAAETEEATSGEDATGDAAADEEYVVDDCNYDEFVYTEFTEIPADWPETFPRPEGLVEIQGETGVGCERLTVDSRSRYYGSNGRDWMTAYGDQLTAAGFELADDYDEYDDLLQWNRTYRRGQDWISYGGDFELVGRDGEYLSLGIVLTDFPD